MSGSNTALDELYSRAESVSTLLVSCQGCTLCCESGMVYVLEDERERLSRLNVPLVTFGPITYIERASGGACPMLDREARRCSIYEDRPFCCRLFPADIFNRRGRLEWALMTTVPLSSGTVRNSRRMATHWV
jgi:Fe-S-cluster containining protein